MRIGSTEPRSDAPPEPTQALAGIRVVELGHHLVGPLVGMYLADLGADVLKVEPPEGDDWRRVEVYKPLEQDGRFFITINRNKRSIVLDLARDEGREIARRLAERADVVVENFRPGTVKRLGVDYDTLARVNPRIIYCSISAFGQTGPDAHKRAFDLIVAGMTGLMVSQPGMAVPLAAPVAITDAAAALLAACGIVTALLVRERQGIGQKIETSLLDAAVAIHAHRFVRIPSIPRESRIPVGAFYRTYRTSDGFLNLVAYSERLRKRLFSALRLEHVARDPRFEGPTKMREHAEELAAVLQEVFLRETTDHWRKVLEDAGVPCGPMRGLDALFDDPQVRHNGLVAEVDHPIAGRSEILGVPVRLAKTPGTVRTPAPTLNQHGEEILRELGYTPGDIGRLRRAGVIPAH